MKKIRKIITVLLFVLCIVLFIIWTVLLSSNKKTTIDKNELFNKDILVIEDNNKYALFNTKAKQITDFEYNNIGEFINGSAIFEDKDNNRGIINTKGKIVVPKDKYNNIVREGFLYRAISKEGDYLLNANGKKIYDLKDKSVKSLVGKYGITIIKSDEYTDILNYKGKSILKFKDDKECEIHTKDNKDIVEIIHDDTTYIINHLSGKIINKLKGKYYIKEVDRTDNNKYILSYKNEDNNYDYIYYNGKKKQYKIDSSECNIYFSYSSVLCSNKNNIYVLNDKGKKAFEYKIDSVDFIDNNNYLIEKNETAVEFHIKKKVYENKDNLKARTVASYENEIYLLKKKTNNKEVYAYYTVKGKQIGEDYKWASEYNNNGIAVVSKDGDKYYFIDLKGKKVSEVYDDIEERGYFNKNLYEDDQQEDVIVAIKGDQKILLNNYGKLIMTTTGEVISHSDGYIKIRENDDIKYFTYEGKLFYKTQEK